jgi:hypothetical protein
MVDMTIIELPNPAQTLGGDLVDADAYDFYREIHKGIRHALFTTTLAAGRLDVVDADAVDQLLAAHGDLLGLLHAHHHHEDEFFQPLLEAHAPTLALEVEGQHADVDAAMAHQAVLATRLRSTPAPGRGAVAHNLYLDLTRLTSAYLAHQLVEETQVMPALRAVVPTEELLALDLELRSTIPPDEMVAAMQHMLPAMDVEERVDMLGGMAMAPPEVFAVFRGAAERALTSAEWAQVAARVGVA